MPGPSRPQTGEFLSEVRRLQMGFDRTYDVAVAGGGPSGLMCAWAAASRGLSVAVIDRLAPELPKKLLITGKGRCNVTNDCEPDTMLGNIPRGSRFLMSALRSFGSAEICRWFEERGVKLKTERGGRVFPASDRARDVAEALARAAKGAGCDILKGRVKGVLTRDGAVCGVALDGGGTLRCRAAAVATGGASYPATGSTGDGYAIARALGHTVRGPFASLVPIECLERDECAALSGLTLKNVAVRYPAEGKAVFSEQGELLFTHFGLSGPLILTLSALTAGTDMCGGRLSIDLKPALEREKLDRRVLRDFSASLNRDFKNSLGGLVPQSLIPMIVSRSGIAPGKKINSVTAAERARLVSTLKGLCFTVTGTRPVDEAIVTTGGVSLKELNPKTMMSKLVRNLHFSGEVIDADGFTGGFNLTIAFATGYAAGRYILSEEVQ